MKLKTAIEILELNIKEAGKKMPADTLDALKLGVQALKREQHYRAVYFSPSHEPLPGETPEGESP